MTRVVLWTTFMLGVGQIIENSRDGGETCALVSTPSIGAWGVERLRQKAALATLDVAPARWGAFVWNAEVALKHTASI